MNNQFWSCTRKLKYSRKAAVCVIALNADRGLRFYECGYSATKKPHYHITHQPMRPTWQRAGKHDRA